MFWGASAAWRLDGACATQSHEWPEPDDNTADLTHGGPHEISPWSRQHTKDSDIETDPLGFARLVGRKLAIRIALTYAQLGEAVSIETYLVGA